jgi:hypothetical protein
MLSIKVKYQRKDKILKQHFNGMLCIKTEYWHYVGR